MTTEAASAPPKSPALTVLLCVHNAEQYLDEAVESILAQTFTDFEFLIFDDGSTDGSPDLLKAIARRDSRVQLVTQANKGLTRTLNDGIRLARGQYLARMDADDFALPDRFAKQVQYLNDNPDCVMVGSRVTLIDPEGEPIRDACKLQTHEEIDAELMKRGWPLVHPAVTIRTATLRDIGGYSEKYRTNQDHDLFLRLAETGRVVNLPEVLLKYRQHFKSISLGNIKGRVDPLLGIMEETYRRRGVAPPTESAELMVEPKTNLTYRREWAWAALAAGNLGTARKHARKVLLQRPWCYQSWRLMYCALRGH